MVQSNAPLGPGQPFSEPFFRKYGILEDIWDYRLKWVTVYYFNILIVKLILKFFFIHKYIYKCEHLLYNIKGAINIDK